jgi:alpha-amylase
VPALPRRSLRLPVLVTAAACALGLALTATPVAGEPRPASRGDARDVARHSLRSDLTDQDFYFVMGDRFNNGDHGNDTGGLTGDENVTGFAPSKRGYYHGGDITGLRRKLDYLEGLGTQAIWFTPIFKNKAVQPEDSSAGYHGYWITDFTQVDPHLGTNAELAGLIKAAHRRGIKVFFDIITNHTADVIGFDEDARPAYTSKDTEPYRDASGRPFDDRDYAGTNTFPKLDPQTSFPYTPVLDPGEETLKKPLWLNDVRLYHNRGNTTFIGEDAQYGDFFGLDDLFTENPRVVRGMTNIYKTWVRDFGIDGFRIDTMKHVDDAFWQSFGPGILDYAHRQGKKDFFMFGEVYDDHLDDAGSAFRSHYTTHDDMQSVLDFGFQAAARNFASKGTAPQDMVHFAQSDDWFTDADSNAYQLPTFLGNHDMGRIGYFLKTDNPGASAGELLARDKLAHALMYFSRGNPVVYYGDEQGFTGSGGDQLARQDMFRNTVTDWAGAQDTDSIGTDETPYDNNFDTDHPMYRAIARLARLTQRNPALRDGAHQARYGDEGGSGIYAFSRIDRRSGREYVVALNNSETDRSADVRTFLRRGTDLKRIYGGGADLVTTGTGHRVEVAVPALSAVVYKSQGVIPVSRRAPDITLESPAPSDAAQGRMHVAADVQGRSFYEVTFQQRVGDRAWRTVGTDDNAPYQVFPDTSTLRTGTPLAYRAVVLDNAGHARMSAVRSTAVPAPEVTITAPKGEEVAQPYPVTVEATVDPERATQTVRIQRSVDGGDWETIGTDSSSPVYTTKDDVSDLDLGTEVSYRAILREPGTPRVTSEPASFVVAAPTPAYQSVTVAGSLQSELGCPGDWQPECTATDLTFDPSDGLWHGTFTFDAGEGSPANPGYFEWKIATGHSWSNPNFGANGGGSNLQLVVPDTGGTYRFTFDQVSHAPSVDPVP